MAGERAEREHVRGLALGARELAGVGDEARRWLVAEDAVEERGHTDAAADVGAEADRRAARADRRPLPSGGATGGSMRVVGVAGAAVDAVDRLDPHRHLRRVRHAERDEAGLLEARDRGGIGFRPAVLERDEPGAVRHARDADRLLDRARDAQERWRVGIGLDPLVRLVGLGQRVGEAVARERVRARLAGVQAVDVRLHDLARGQLLRTDRGREVGGAALGELRGGGGDGHGLANLPPHSALGGGSPTGCR